MCIRKSRHRPYDEYHACVAFFKDVGASMLGKCPRFSIDDAMFLVVAVAQSLLAGQLARPLSRSVWTTAVIQGRVLTMTVQPYHLWRRAAVQVPAMSHFRCVLLIYAHLFKAQHLLQHAFNIVVEPNVGGADRSLNSSPIIDCGEGACKVCGGSRKQARKVTMTTL